LLAALVAKPGGVALVVGGGPLGWLAAFVAVRAGLGVLALLHGLLLL
jgi:threonine dehydrogenase-like Zn-dependent dehydrogenase